MKNVLLVNPPWIKKGGVWKEVVGCSPPFGLAMIAACLEKAGHNVKIMDMNALHIPIEKLETELDNYEKPDFIGLSATTLIINNALECARICKNKFHETGIIFGGVHATILPEDILKNRYVDFVVRGEGEETIIELIDGQDIKEIEGISYREEGKIIHNTERKPPLDLDKLPLPAYHLLPMDKYIPSKGTYKRLPALNVITSRGCPGRCTFCYKMSNILRFRSAERVIEEIKFLKENYGIREIGFHDDTFTANRERVKKICEQLKELDITWSCFARVDFIDEELLSIMKKAGCHQIMYGVESADETILKNINKKINLEQVEKAVKFTKKVGIEDRLAFMIGNPGETIETMKKTLKFAIKINPALFIINITTPFPGTEMFKWANEKGYLKTHDWDKYDLSTVVMELPTISSDEIIKFYDYAYRKFYFRPKVFIEQLKRISSKDDIINLMTNFRGLVKFLNKSRIKIQTNKN